MGRLLAIGAIVVGVYALWAGQNPGQAFKPSVPAALFSPSAEAGGSVSAAAAAAARRIGN